MSTWQKIKQSKIISFLGHIIALAGLFIWWLPVRFLYLGRMPQIGVDYFQFPGYVKYLIENFTLPILSWRYIWYEGIPAIFDNQWLHFYLAIPLVKIYGLFQGTEIYLLGTLFLYFVFAYFLFWELSKSKFFSFALSFSIVWGLDSYVALFNGGNSNFSANQLFLPLVLWILIKYLNSENRRFFYLATLLMGLSFWSHVGSSAFFVYIPAGLVLLFWWKEGTRIVSLNRVKDFFIFSFFSWLVGLVTSYFLLNLFFTSSTFGRANLSKEAALPTALVDYFRIANYFILILPILLFVFILIKKKFNIIKRSFSFIFALAYMWFLEFLYVIAKNPLRVNILNDRTYWVITILSGGLLALLWNGLKENFKKDQKFRFLFREMPSFLLKISVIFTLVVSPFILCQETVLKEEAQRIVPIIPLRMHQIILASEEERMKEIMPSWFPKDELNWRFYNKDPNVAYWWGLENKMPYSHGNYSSQNKNAGNWAYWLDLSVSGELFYKYDFPRDFSKKQAQFLIDWYGIKYLEGIEMDVDKELWQPGMRIDYVNKIFKLASGSNSSYVSSYLTEDEDIITKGEMTSLKEIEINPGTLSEIEFNLGRKLTDEDKKFGDLYFYEVSNQATSPLFLPTDTPTVLVVGNEIGYDGFFRSLAASNINSKSLIPVYGPENISGLSKYELSDFDSIFLYNYESSKAGWKILSDYISDGGTVIIDTGSEVEESALAELPDIFPVSSTRRDELGREWDINLNNESEFVQNIDFKSFDKLEYEGDPWKLSFTSEDGVKPGAKIILSQEDNPVLVEQKIGQGKVIWSGINLPYRLQYYRNVEETKLFNNIIESISSKSEKIDFEFQRPKPEKVIIESPKTKGFLFKENWDGGWRAKITASGKTEKVKVYKAGPDFMYIHVPSDFDNNSELKAELYYRGSFLAWFLFILSLLTMLWLIKKILWPKKVLVKKIFPRLGLKKKVKDWWWKDDEY